MTESAERAGVHEHYPDFNMANARRLIAALRRAEPADVACERPMEIGGSPLDRSSILDMAASAEGTHPGAAPLAYNQSTWGTIVYHPWGSRVPAHVCGTAACIAGFAWLMREADRGRDVSVEGLASSNNEDNEMVCALAEFLGVGESAASRMSINQCGAFRPHPRHAVAMIERFIETGRVDWQRAIGCVRVERRKRDWKGWRPWRVRKWFEWEVTEEERGRRRDDARSIRLAVRERLSRTAESRRAA